MLISIWLAARIGPKTKVLPNMHNTISTILKKINKVEITLLLKSLGSVRSVGKYQNIKVSQFPQK